MKIIISLSEGTSTEVEQPKDIDTKDSESEADPAFSVAQSDVILHDGIGERMIL